MLSVFIAYPFILFWVLTSSVFTWIQRILLSVVNCLKHLQLILPFQETRLLISAIPIGNLPLRLCSCGLSIENSNLKDRMKRDFVNSHQFYASLEDSKVNHRYHYLLEDYLELQKEYVSKRKKIQIAKQKREILLVEVRFLRQRHKYLMKSQLAKVESDFNIYQNADIHDAPVRKEMNYIVNESVVEQEGREREELVWKKQSIEKKPKNCLINDNKSGKRKISWQDEVTLKV